MNDIRKNFEEEEILVEGTFKLSPGAILIWVLGVLFFGTPLIFFIIAAPSMTGEVNGEPASGWEAALPFVIMFGILLFIFVVAQTLKLIAIKKSQLVVTNKRIYGVYHVLIARKNFSYRLDEVDNVEMVSSLGRHTLAVQFTPGHGPAFAATTYVNGIPTSSGFGVLRMSNLKNYKEVMDVMNSLITSRKNLVDVQTDIEMSKISAENRKADALENVAKNIAGNPVNTQSNNRQTKSDDYIEELRKLKQLLDDGIINQQEFDQEKKEILDNNHK